jgi:hypothetical protein
MSKDVGLRKRKAQLKEKRNEVSVSQAFPLERTMTWRQKSDDGSAIRLPESPTNSVLNTLMYLVIFSAVGGAIYLAKPELVTGLVQEFLGIEAGAGGDYSSGGSQVPNWWAADEEKRDAVVSAFKWAWHAYGECVEKYLTTGGCLHCFLQRETQWVMTSITPSPGRAVILQQPEESVILLSTPSTPCF